MFRGQDGAGIAGAPVKAEGGSYGCGGGQTAYAQTDEDGEYRNHQQHGQTGGGVDAQADAQAQHPAQGQYQVGRFQFQ